VYSFCVGVSVASAPGYNVDCILFTSPPLIVQDSLPYSRIRSAALFLSLLCPLRLFVSKKKTGTNIF
jgi:hypothetical protein